MTREEHNLQPDDLVISRLGGGEESQYDSMCAACYMGRQHTWREHDSYIEFRRAQLRQDQYQESLRYQLSLPSVDPSADDYLEKLFAWGDAFVKMFGVTAEDVDEAERR